MYKSFSMKKRKNLGDVVTTLNDGDVFTLSQQDTTNILGTIKYSLEDYAPYGYYFVSDDNQYTVELGDGMYGFIKRHREDENE